MNAFLFTGNQLLISLESQALTLPPPTAIFYFYLLFFLPHWLGFINRKKVFPHLSSAQQLCSLKYGCSPVSVYISTWRGVTLSRCQTQTCIVSLILGRRCIVRYPSSFNCSCLFSFFFTLALLQRSMSRRVRPTSIWASPPMPTGSTPMAADPLAPSKLTATWQVCVSSVCLRVCLPYCLAPVTCERK